ncbi:hypothetical protein LINPERHAP1_LOCUS11323 [Linum perenne]
MLLGLDQERCAKSLVSNLPRTWVVTLEFRSSMVVMLRGFISI